MHSWIRGVALLIYGGQHHIEHDSPLEHGHPTTSDPSTILLREYQLVLKVPIGTARSKIHTLSKVSRVTEIGGQNTVTTVITE